MSDLNIWAWPESDRFHIFCTDVKGKTGGCKASSDYLIYNKQTRDLCDNKNDSPDSSLDCL